MAVDPPSPFYSGVERRIFCIRYKYGEWRKIKETAEKVAKKKAQRPSRSVQIRDSDDSSESRLNYQIEEKVRVRRATQRRALLEEKGRRVLFVRNCPLMK